MAAPQPAFKSAIVQKGTGSGSEHHIMKVDKAHHKDVTDLNEVFQQKVWTKTTPPPSDFENTNYVIYLQF